MMIGYHNNRIGDFYPLSYWNVLKPPLTHTHARAHWHLISAKKSFVPLFFPSRYACVRLISLFISNLVSRGIGAFNFDRNQ